MSDGPISDRWPWSVCFALICRMSQIGSSNEGGKWDIPDILCKAFCAKPSERKKSR